MEVSSCRQGLCYLLLALTHLFAHQDLRYTWSLHQRRGGSLWTRTRECLLNTFTFTH
uniref:Uncharacterized protein n=1 Tax=Helianthus annuus TaxID=4232 RepID=A0A251VKP3_HELAN